MEFTAEDLAAIKAVLRPFGSISGADIIDEPGRFSLIFQPDYCLSDSFVVVVREPPDGKARVTISGALTGVGLMIYAELSRVLLPIYLRQTKDKVKRATADYLRQTKDKSDRATADLGGFDNLDHPMLDVANSQD